MFTGVLSVAFVALHLTTPAASAGLALKPTKTYAGTYVGSTSTAAFPPPDVPIDHSLFPPGDVLGYEGKTATGDEAFAIQTAPAYAYNHDFVPLIQPDVEKSRRKNEVAGDIGLVVEDTNQLAEDYDEEITKKKKKKPFNPVRSWGNLTPWFSTSFGLKQASPLIPDQCTLTQVHMVHRHGARYPTAGEGPSVFSAKLHAAAQTGRLRFTKDLAFLNFWTYKLGEELLTPFGRKQMFDLGVSFRSNYGSLLKNFTEKGTFPVFRSETQDRMVKSALNFAAGFFGIPYEDQYQLSLIVEDVGYNNTFAPYYKCTNAFKAFGPESPSAKLSKVWRDKYLAKARERLQRRVSGMVLTIADTYAMQQLCAYETVALGYSAFCPLFTKEEWIGFQYASDLSFWYASGFGSPVAAAQGAGYANELLHRLKNLQPVKNPFRVNQTLDGSKITFPLNQSIYVDATHEIVVVNILTALNFKALARNGPLPGDEIPEDRSFITSHIAPFGTNLVIQVLDCTDFGRSIRFFLNDGALPIGIKGCPKNKNGLCPLDIFIRGLQERLDGIDWKHDCLADYEFTTDITDGRAPR